MNQDQSNKLNVERERGAYAQELLNNPEFQAIWTELREQITTQLEVTNGRDPEGERVALTMLRVLGALRRRVEDRAQTGKMARMQLEQESALKKGLSWLTGTTTSNA